MYIHFIWCSIKFYIHVYTNSYRVICVLIYLRTASIELVGNSECKNVYKSDFNSTNIKTKTPLKYNETTLSFKIFFYIYTYWKKEGKRNFILYQWESYRFIYFFFFETFITFSSFVSHFIIYKNNIPIILFHYYNNESIMYKGKGIPTYKIQNNIR